MPAYKSKNNNTWFVKFWYKNLYGERKNKTKRGFATKREALEWEREFLLKYKGSPEMKFETFVEKYLEDVKARIKDSTYEMKKSVIEKRITPFFKNKAINMITTTDVMQWQNELLRWEDPLTGKGFSKSYLKTVHNQLSALLNHAVRYYGLAKNPAGIVGNMGSEKDIQMEFWTLQEYKKFSESMMKKPVSYYAFQVLYWTGMRLGEMLALGFEDVDLKGRTITVSKTYRRARGEDIITSPKTAKSNRVISIPEFLAEELSDYIDMIYDKDETRLFPVTKWYIEAEMKRGIREQGLKPIRVHDLRHSHVSLLINSGYSALEIADRMGHESIDITYRYAHLFPNVQRDMASKLDALNREVTTDGKKQNK